MTQQFHSTAQAPVIAEPPQYTSRSATQYRAADWKSEILVPLLMALVTGILALILVAWLWWEWDWLPDWSPVAAFVCTFGGVWVWRLRRHDAMLTAAEEITRLDLNRHGTIGRPVPPEAPPKTLHVDLSRPNPRTGSPQLIRFDLPCDVETLYLVAEAMLAGSTLPNSDWTPIKAGKPFSEVGLQKFKDALITNGLARPISKENPRLGLMLTDEGKAFMAEIKKQANSPTGDE
jgi:hypothetical protein